MLAKNNGEEEKFMNELSKVIKRLNMENIQNIEVLNMLSSLLQMILKEYGINIQRSGNENCSRDLKIYK